MNKNIIALFFALILLFALPETIAQSDILVTPANEADYFNPRLLTPQGNIAVIEENESALNVVLRNGQGQTLWTYTHQVPFIFQRNALFYIETEQKIALLTLNKREERCMFFSVYLIDLNGNLNKEYAIPATPQPPLVLNSGIYYLKGSSAPYYLYRMDFNGSTQQKTMGNFNKFKIIWSKSRSIRENHSYMYLFNELKSNKFQHIIGLADEFGDCKWVYVLENSEKILELDVQINKQGYSLLAYQTGISETPVELVLFDAQGKQIAQKRLYTTSGGLYGVEVSLDENGDFTVFCTLADTSGEYMTETVFDLYLNIKANRLKQSTGVVKRIDGQIFSMFYDEKSHSISYTPVELFPFIYSDNAIYCE